MGYLCLLVALVTATIKGYCGKKTSSITKNLNDAILANTIRILICTMTGFFLCAIGEGFKSLVPSFEMLMISALSGISMAVFLVSWLVSIKRSAYMMVDIFIMLSILIPLIGSNIFFDESIKPIQWLGVLILFGAVVVMCSYNNSIKAKITPTALFLLSACSIANGVSDFSQKLFIHRIPDGSVAAFNFYTYLFTSVILVFALISRRKHPITIEKNNFKFLTYITIMAVCLFANSYFRTLAARYLSSIILYPLNHGCTLILSTVMAAVCFKEKLRLKAVIGILLSFVSMVIINLL